MKKAGRLDDKLRKATIERILPCIIDSVPMPRDLVESTGFSDEDAKAIRDALPSLFESDASSARPEGNMEVLKVVWWQHNRASGQCSSAKVHRSLKVAENGEIFFDDVNGPSPEIIDGV